MHKCQAGFLNLQDLKLTYTLADEAIKNGTTDEIMQSYKRLKEYKKRSKKL